jgi:surfeit locus 1 family protein
MTLALMYLSLAALFAGFAALGTWQIHRRAWKLDLIARVEQRVHASPVAAPGRDAWARMSADDEYRRVSADGAFLSGRSVFVQAVTERGPGFWMLTPLQTRTGFIVLINRGFVETAADGGAPSQDPVSVSGLLRLTEPRGGFLRRNDPAAQRWYSRDVAAIAAAQQLPAQDVAPYFIDADAVEADGPVGGMTVLRFHNSHLVYAITWYSLALMVAGAAVILGRQQPCPEPPGHPRVAPGVLVRVCF